MEDSEPIYPARKQPSQPCKQGAFSAHILRQHAKARAHKHGQ
jgi:hypothetical protein